MLLPSVERARTYPASVASRARDYRSRTADGAIAMHAVGILSTLLTFALFMLGSELTIFPFLVLLGTIGFGWRTYQSELAKGLTLLTTVATVTVLALIIIYSIKGKGLAGFGKEMIHHPFGKNPFLWVPNLLLNTGPLPDGSIHAGDAETLRRVGERIRKRGFPA